MTTAAESEQQISGDAERPVSGAAPGGLTAPPVVPSGSAPQPNSGDSDLSLSAAPHGIAVLPGLDGADAGLCIGGFCRLPGATS